MTIQNEGPLGRQRRSRHATVPLSRTGRAVKRSFDLVVAILSLLILLPLLAIVALALILESREPIFSQEILYGYSNRAIRVLKFRSTSAFSKRIRGNGSLSPVGRVLRRSGIDEIPRFLNVINGEMSIVGHRPSPKGQVVFSPRLVPLLNVKPGMTGWAQIMEVDEGPRSMEQKINDDLYYVEHWSLLLDIKIIFRTILA